MQWLVLSWALTIGYLPMQTDSIVNGAETVHLPAPENAIATTFELDAVAFDHLRAWGKMRSYESFAFDRLYMVPWRIDFSIGAEVFYGPFALGVWHECDHGVDSSRYMKPWYSRGTTEIYIAIRGEVKY
jgi:hypothetical protein